MNRDLPDGPVIAMAVIAGALLGVSMLEASNTLDGALVVAGILRYPPDSVMGVYFQNSWTVLHQAGAALLLMGASQEAMVMALNAAFGACAMCGVLLISRALLRNLWAALAIALVVLHVGLVVRFDDYPQGFHDADYGSWTATVFFLAVGLLGARRMFAAGCVSLFAIAVHPVVGAWTALVACCAAFCVARDDPADGRRFLRGALAGALFSTLSFLWYWFARAPEMQGYDAELYRVYMEVWEGHRKAPHNPSILALGAVSISVLTAILGRRRASDDAAGTGTLYALIISAAASTLVYESVHRLPEYLPDLVLRAMLARVAVLHLALLIPMGFAALAENRWPVLVLPALAGLAALLHPLLGVAATALACALLYSNRPLLPAFAQRWSPLLRSTLALVVCVVFAERLMAMMAGQKWQVRAEASGKPAIWLAIESRFAPRPTDPDPPVFFAGPDPDRPKLAREMHERGVVAAPGVLQGEIRQKLHLPTLLDTTSIDFVPYLPGTVTKVAGIIQEVYGIEFRNPSIEQRGGGALADEDGKDFWPTLSAQDWARLAPKYCIGGVMAPAGWVLQLPVTHDFGTAKYYRVQAELPSGCR